MTTFTRLDWQCNPRASTALGRRISAAASIVFRRACLVVFVGAAVTSQAGAVELGIDGARFTLDGKPTFLLGVSYYGALGAPEEFIQRDLDDLQRHGFNWIRVWATWSFFDNDVSAVDEAGKPREPYLGKLKWLVAECDRRGMVVDVTLMRSNGKTGVGRLKTPDAHRRTVETLATTLKLQRNWFLDLANERSVGDARFVSIEELKQLRDTVKRLDPRRLMTASDGDLSRDELREHLWKAEMDFITPHRDRHPGSPKETEAQSRKYLSLMQELKRVVPVLYQEPFRRGYAPREWEPTADAFLTDLKGALAGGAAGWCFHNGDQKDQPAGQPRRSFDLRQRRLFEQLDEDEHKFLRAIPQVLRRQGSQSGASVAGPREGSNGFATYTVTCPYQSRPTQVEVLPPDNLKAGENYRVLYLLPVNDGIMGEWGSGIVEARRHNIHNRFNVICVSPEYDYTPWYGDHPSDPALRQESYLLDIVVPLIEERYPVVKAREGRFLLGFSKSGFGAITIALRNLDQIGKAAAWDAPLMMNSPLPSEEEMQRVFATPENFDHYCVPALVEKHLATLQTGPPRLVLVSNGRDRGEILDLHQRLDQRGIPHRFKSDEKRAHTWTSQWLPVVAELLFAPDPQTSAPK